ncbi:unnamed protein product [Cuscuta campestris]|uniref:Uncharacterized protein n=1 Tax=Cuscuta campestris TaxID=132261 RepID=A0A484MVY3_9ASTE|nr:unnamed protein product [Cuscuta campestris]
MHQDCVHLDPNIVASLGLSVCVCWDDIYVKLNEQGRIEPYLGGAALGYTWKRPQSYPSPLTSYLVKDTPGRVFVFDLGNSLSTFKEGQVPLVWSDSTPVLAWRPKVSSHGGAACPLPYFIYLSHGSAVKPIMSIWTLR